MHCYFDKWCFVFPLTTTAKMLSNTNKGVPLQRLEVALYKTTYHLGLTELEVCREYDDDDDDDSLTDQELHKWYKGFRV